MKITSSLLLAAAVLCFSACSESTTTETETTATESAPAETTTTDPFADVATDSAFATDMEASAEPATTTEPITQTVTGQTDAEGNITFKGPETKNGLPVANPSGAATGQRLNPAHGEPGHDCAVAVGAPLGGSSAGTAPKPAATPKLNAPATINPTPVAAPSQQGAVASGLNPAHGEPGHDCAIPVGAPLKK